MIYIGERVFAPGSVGGFFKLKTELKDMIDKTPPPADTSPPKHYVLAKKNDCWKGSSLRDLPAHLLPLPGRPFSSAKYWSDGQSKKLPDHIRPQDTVTVCWEESEPDALTKVGKFAESATKTAIKSVANPTKILDEIPGVNQLTQYIPSMPDPIKLATNLAAAVSEGDLRKLKSSVLDIGYQVASIAAMVPGVGNVVGGPLSAALALIESGSTLKAALALLLNEIPGIPPQIRDVLRVALNGIADIVENQQSVTDVLIVEFRKGVRDQVEKSGISGPVADLIDMVLDGAIQIIFQKKPLDETALNMAQEGLDIAKKKAAEGIGSIDEVREAEGTLSQLRNVYKAINEKKIGSKMPESVRSVADKAPTRRPPKLRAPSSKKKRPPQLRTSPSKKELEQLKELAKLSPEEQKALAALSPDERKALAEMKPDDQKRVAQLEPRARKDMAKALAARKRKDERAKIEVKSPIPYRPYPPNVRA